MLFVPFIARFLTIHCTKTAMHLEMATLLRAEMAAEKKWGAFVWRNSAELGLPDRELFRLKSKGLFLPSAALLLERYEDSQ